MLRTIPLLLVASLVAGCLEDLPSPDQVVNLRILAIRAQPPEVAPGDSVTIEGLVVDPQDRPISLRWQACLIPERDTGFFGGSGAGASGGRGFGLEDPGTCATLEAVAPDEVLDLGTSNPVRLNIPADILADDDVVASVYGLPTGGVVPAEVLAVLKAIAGVNMFVSLEAEVSGDRRTAFKRVNVSLNSDRNRNPIDVAFHLTDDAEANPAPETGEAPLGRRCFLQETADSAPIPLKVGEYRITPVNVPQDPPEYQVILGGTSIDEPFGIQTKEEQTFYTFYTDAGGFRNRNLKTGDGALWSTLEVRGEPGTIGHVWVVIRDGRGGTDFCASQFVITEQ